MDLFKTTTGFLWSDVFLRGVKSYLYGQEGPKWPGEILQSLKTWPLFDQNSALKGERERSDISKSWSHFQKIQIVKTLLLGQGRLFVTNWWFLGQISRNYNSPNISFLI